jgi:hypothetical protein
MCKSGQTILNTLFVGHFSSINRPHISGVLTVNQSILRVLKELVEERSSKLKICNSR